MNSRDLGGVPKFILARFNYVNAYVWEMLFPDSKVALLTRGLSTKKQRNSRLRELKRISNEAALAYFIYDVKRFFSAGSTAAKNAVDTFSELQVDGFYIGSTLFKGRNENVTMGDSLAGKLLTSISDNELKSLITNSFTGSRIIDYYKILIDERYGR